MSKKANETLLISDQAIDWYARLNSGEAQASDWRDFTTWLEEDSRHGKAYDTLELSLDFSSESIDEASNHTDHITDLPPKAVNENRKPIFWISAASSIAALFIIALVLPGILSTGPDISHEYVTKIGENDSITLADGTRVAINTDTHLTFTMNKNQRSVVLHKGEAFFEIASDKKRDFIVTAMNTEIHDVGTKFDVNLTSSKLAVAVQDGLVDVIPKGLSKHETKKVQKRVKGGQKAIRILGQNKLQVVRVDPSSISSWKSGILIFDDTPLPDLVENVNRYFNAKIVIVDARANTLKFSGVLNIENQDKVLQALTGFLPVHFEQSDGNINLSVAK